MYHSSRFDKNSYHSRKRVALVYDRVNKWGGAERVIIALRKIFPDSVLFTSVYKEDRASWARKIPVKTSFRSERVNKWGGAERVIIALRKIFPDSVLFTSVYKEDRASWARKIPVKTSF